MIRSLSIHVFWWRACENCNRLVKRISQVLRHINIEPQSGRDGGLAFQRSGGVHTYAIGAQNDDVLGTKETARDEAVHNDLSTFGQINKHVFLFGFLNQGITSPFVWPPYNQPFRSIESTSRGQA